MAKTIPQKIEGFIPGLRAGKQAMYEAAETNPPAGVSSVVDKDFRRNIAVRGITAKETPMAFLGAYAARLAGDIVAEETRGVYWRYNHPIAIADKIAQKVIDPNKTLPRYTSAAIGAAILTPAFALSGAYDPTNITELGRPKGFKQNRPDPEDPTKSLEPATELFERYMQGRQGRPLAYPKAKEEIPDLTQQRYANYMNFLYNEGGFLGMAKVTPENLQGVPEARIFGYPVSIPTVTTAAAGIAGARAALKYQPKELKPDSLMGRKSMRGIAGGTVGAAAGAVAGVLMNQAIAASQKDTQLPMQ
jgi:hypothetical protein